MGGEKRARLTATRKLISEFPDCCLCAGLRPSTSREHMPPVALFDNRHRPDDLVMPACDACNSATRTADLTASIVSRWNLTGSDTEREDHRRLAARIQRQAPDILAEWTAGVGDPFRSSRGRRHLRRQGVLVPLEAEVVTVGPLTMRQLNLFARKATLALYFEHFKRPLRAPSVYWCTWHTKEDFHAGPPIDLLKILPAYATLQQGSWSADETFGYRYNINIEENLFGFSAYMRRGRSVSGFVVPSNYRPEEDKRWFSPGDLAVLLHAPELAKRSPFSE